MISVLHISYMRALKVPTLLTLFLALSEMYFGFALTYVYWTKFKLISLEQYILLFGCFSILITLMEIPLGALADYFGRRFMLFISASSMVISHSIILLCSGFEYLLLAGFFGACGFAACSGVCSALLYEYLEVQEKKHEYKHYEAKMRFVASISMASACIIGALLFMFHPHLPQLMTICAALLSVIPAFLLHDQYKPRYKSFPLTQHTFNLSLTHIQAVAPLAVLTGSIMFLITFIQPLAAYNHVSLLYLGFIYALFNLLQGVGHYIYTYVRCPKTYLYGCIGFAIIALFSNHILFFTLASLALFLASGISALFIRAVLNEQSTSYNRTTILSIHSALSRFVMFVFACFTSFIVLN